MQIALDASLRIMQYSRMTLDDYLTINDESADAFAKRIRRATSTVTRLRNGETKPDWETSRLIFDATGGAVTPNDFFDLSNHDQKGAPASQPPTSSPALNASNGCCSAGNNEAAE